MDCIGAIDQGTQSTRFLLYDKTAKLVASHQVEFTQITPEPGSVHCPTPFKSDEAPFLRDHILFFYTRINPG